MHILVTLICFDMLCIVFNLMIFGFPRLWQSYEEQVWPYIIPTVLPLAQIALTGMLKSQFSQNWHQHMSTNYLACFFEYFEASDWLMKLSSYLIRISLEILKNVRQITWNSCVDASSKITMTLAKKHCPPSPSDFLQIEILAILCWANLMLYRNLSISRPLDVILDGVLKMEFLVLLRCLFVDFPVSRHWNTTTL